MITGIIIFFWLSFPSFLFGDEGTLIQHNIAAILDHLNQFLLRIWCFAGLKGKGLNNPSITAITIRIHYESLKYEVVDLLEYVLVKVLSHMLTRLFFELREETFAHHNYVLKGAILVLLKDLSEHDTINGWNHHYEGTIQNRARIG